MPAEPSAKTHVQGRALELDIMYDSVMLNEIEKMDAYEEHMAAYVALCIEENLLNKIKQFKYKCSGCASILLNSNDRINDELLAKKTIQIGQAKQPSQSTLKIVVFANAVMKLISSECEQGNDFGIVWKTIFNYLDIDDLYSTEDFEQHGNKLSFEYTHKEEFVIELVRTYMTLKSMKIGKKITEEERGESVRHKNKDAVKKAGQ